MYGWLIAAGSWLLMAYVATSYYTSSQETIQTLRDSNIKLESSLVSCELRESELEEQKKEEEIAVRNLETRLNEARQAEDVLQKLFRNHDLTKLAAAKPGLIETRINNAIRESNENMVNITSE